MYRSGRVRGPGGGEGRGGGVGGLGFSGHGDISVGECDISVGKGDISVREKKEREETRKEECFRGDGDIWVVEGM